VNAEAWEAEGNWRSPAFGRQPFHFVAANPAQLLPAQYELHIWPRDNPSGQFSQYNPAVSCRHHVRTMPMLHPDETGEMVMPEPHPHIFGRPVADGHPYGAHPPR
jgi:hypothetical protein